MLAWGEMARQVAHEIKNPLTPIRLGVQHLRRARGDNRVDFGRVFEQNVERILAEIDRLDEIARAFSRYGMSPAERLDPVALDVAAITRDVVDLERMAADGVVWHVATPSAPVMGLARDDELREVLLNVMENARQAGANRIDVAVSQSDGHVEVTVRDDGDGVAAEDLDRIFEPRFSTRTSGSGLGSGDQPQHGRSVGRAHARRARFRRRHGHAHLARHQHDAVTFPPWRSLPTTVCARCAATPGHGQANVVTQELPPHLTGWQLPPDWRWGSEGVRQEHRHYQEIVDALGRSLALVTAPDPAHAPWLAKEARYLAHRNHSSIPTTYHYWSVYGDAKRGPGYLRRWLEAETSGSRARRLGREDHSVGPAPAADAGLGPRVPARHRTAAWRHFARVGLDGARRPHVAPRLAVVGSSQRIARGPDPGSALDAVAAGVERDRLGANVRVRSVDARRDLFLSLTGEMPPAENVPPLDLVSPGVPQALVDILGRALSRDPDERFPTMSALLRTLEHAGATPRRSSERGSSGTGRDRRGAHSLGRRRRLRDSRVPWAGHVRQRMARARSVSRARSRAQGAAPARRAGPQGSVPVPS